MDWRPNWLAQAIIGNAAFWLICQAMLLLRRNAVRTHAVVKGLPASARYKVTVGWICTLSMIPLGIVGAVALHHLHGYWVGYVACAIPFAGNAWLTWDEHRRI